MNRDRKLWNPQEDNAIRELVQDHGCKNWAFISQKMKTLYDIHDRSGKQCRERWINHLDPDINKDKWSEEEEEKVFRDYLMYGNRWKEISQHFPGRTDNCIKNHFYSTLRRSLRRINKFVGIRNSTEKMREIKPSILSKMLDSSMKTQDLNNAFKDFAEILFQFSGFKPTKDNIGLMHDLINTKYKKNIIDVLLKISELNETYAKTKDEKPPKKKLKTPRTARKRVKFEEPAFKQHTTGESPLKSRQKQQSEVRKEELDSNENLSYSQKSSNSERSSKQQKQEEEQILFSSPCKKRAGFRYCLDQKSQKFDLEMRQPDQESYYFKDLQIVGQPLKVVQMQGECPVQDGEIFEMIYEA